MALPSVNPEPPRRDPDRPPAAGRAGLGALAPLAWVGALLAASRVGPAAEALPVLRVLHGPIALVLIGLAAAVTAASLAGPVRVPAASPRLLLALAWAFLLSVGLSYSTRLRVSGDEPHYLLMAQSLWRDHDLDLRDDYAGGDWREYTPGPIEPHYGFPRKDGRPFPVHAPGLPLLLAPLYALGGRALCVAALTLAAAALAREMALAARRVTGDDEAAWWAGALAIVPPVAFYSFHVYTEVPSALALAVGLRLVSTPGGAARAVVAALLAAALPWLHLKMIPAAAVMGVVGLARLRGRARLAFLGTAAVSGTAFLFYYHAIFGVASPLALYGGLPDDADGRPLRALAGLMLDRSFGLLPYAPVFLVGLAGFGALVRRRQWVEVVLLLALIGPILAWRMWWGGQCPPARFLVPAVPLLALAAAARIADSRRGLARWRWPLLGLGVVTTVGMVWRPDALLLLNRGDRPTRLWSALSGEWPVARYLPSMTSAGADEVRVAVVWIVALAALLALDVAARRDDRVDRLFRTFGLPVLLLLAVGTGVDGWARGSAAGDRAQDDQGLLAACHRGRQRSAGQLVGQILAAREEPHERAALEGDVAADGAAERGIPLLEGVEDGAERDRPLDLHAHLRLRAAQRAQGRGNLDADHGSVWTSTDSTAGRSRTIGFHVSPPSDEPYTCPPVVPKYTPHGSSESTDMASRSTLT